MFCQFSRVVYSLYVFFFFFLMIRRPPRSTHCISSAASDVYKRQFISIFNFNFETNALHQSFLFSLSFSKSCYFGQQCVDKMPVIHSDIHIFLSFYLTLSYDLSFCFFLF
eukprot:TRINITY_DN1321_c0_g1_i11.p4 TRINITY_DN1321_c0_g1~~TRINITY_DN1321_c0_g1_i11.p4  ORF type:complete len:110 (-),score=22.45 TRINITY_DN1321_c0_g1_i11:177-506(-)